MISIKEKNNTFTQEETLIHGYVMRGIHIAKNKGKHECRVCLGEPVDNNILESLSKEGYNIQRITKKSITNVSIYLINW